MSRANLSCPRVSCTGEFERVGESDETTLYRCRDCGETLAQGGIEDLADQDGALGQLAKALLEGEA